MTDCKPIEVLALALHLCRHDLNYEPVIHQKSEVWDQEIMNVGLHLRTKGWKTFFLLLKQVRDGVEAS